MCSSAGQQYSQPNQPNPPTQAVGSIPSARCLCLRVGGGGVVLLEEARQVGWSSGTGGLGRVDQDFEVKVTSPDANLPQIGYRLALVRLPS